jgi:predicted DNA-binding transcriptional regulator AlpA
MAEMCMRTPAAAAYVALAASTLTKMRLTGDGPKSVKVGPRSVAYRKVDLDAWLEARVRRSTSDGQQGKANRTSAEQADTHTLPLARGGLIGP